MTILRFEHTAGRSVHPAERLQKVAAIQCALLLVMLMCSPFTALAQSGDLIRNSSLSDTNHDGRPDDWTLITDNGAGQFKLLAGRNGNMIQITKAANKKGAPTAMSGGWKLSEMTPVKPQTPLVLEVRVRSAGGKAVALAGIEYRTIDNQWLSIDDSGRTDVAGPWQTLTVRSLAPESAAYAQVILQSHAGAVQFDQPRLLQRDWPADIQPASGKLFFMNMDYYDMVVLPGPLHVHTYRQKEIAGFFDHCRKFGVDGVLWRVSICGQMAYPSKVATVFPGRADPAKLTPAERDMADILKTMDPLAVAIKEAHQRGIQLYIWMTISDEAGTDKDNPNLETNNLILDHPEYALLSRDGKPMIGTLAYSEPAVRAYRLAVLRELVSYKADGIYLCTRTHAFYHNTDKAMDYGYNPPVVEEYRERYGVNILKQPFDEEKWLQIRTEGLTTFMREAADIVHGAHQKLWLGISTTLNEKYGWPYGDALLPWKSWLQSGRLDGIISGHYYTPIGQIPAIAKAFHEVAAKDQTLLLWQQCWNYQEEHFTPIQDLIRQVQMIASTSANGATYHEAHNFESLPPKDYWQPLADAIKKWWKAPPR